MNELADGMTYLTTTHAPLNIPPHTFYFVLERD